MAENSNGEAQQRQLMTDAVLRRMNHGEWLAQFASMLMIQPAEQARPMTPFRSGAASRLKMAAAYIDLLHREARDNVRWIEALKLEINDLKRVIREENGDGEDTGR